MCCTLAAVFVLAVVFIGDFLQLTALSFGGWLVFASLAMLAVPMIGYFTKGLDWLSAKYTALKRRISRHKAEKN